MSRIIVKNIPKFVTQKQLQEHFKDLGTITDSKIMKDEKGVSRKFGFVGFKDPNSAQLARKNYNKTYLGVSKVLVQIAKTRSQEEKEQEKGKRKQKIGEKEQMKNNKKKQKQTEKRFKEYRKIVEEGVKKSWDDLLVPQTMLEQESQERQNKSEINQTNKKELKQSKKKQQNKPKQQMDEGIKGIKAPKLSQKNKKYISKPLGIDQCRLYITNIPYQISEDELHSTFSKFGCIKKIKLPVEYDGKTKGYCFITYQSAGEAMRAFSEINNKVVFGRILHAMPAAEDIGSIIKNGKQAEFEEKVKQKYGETEEQKTSYKKQKKRQMREKLLDTTSWNTLFLNPNTILETMSQKLGITKSQILLSQNLAAKIALSEAQVIEQTKQWMVHSGLNVQFLEIDRNLCERSKNVILIKNLNYRTQQSQMRQLFEFYGIVRKLLVAPNRAIAIVEYETPEFAHNALEKLQNYKFKNNFIYLEYAPIGMLKEDDISQKINKMQEELAEAEEISKVVYIKNLNFETGQSALNQFLSKVGEPKSIKIIRNSKNNNKSMGYGFAEFSNNETAKKVIKQLQNNILDNHRLMLSVSKKTVQIDQFDKIKELKKKIKNQQKVSPKLVVRNLAFEASKSEIRELFKHYGSIKVVRLPKRMDGRHRGFGFVEFDTVEEAALAKKALSNAHLYGRKLVIEYEQGSSQKSK